MRAGAAAIDAEIAALEAVAGSCLAESFGKAQDLIFGCRGKVVVTGMGKAGLIGVKISATLRSTGQPSVFLDPAQALHGDMGMIGRQDSVLALSNSGRTNEVLAVCAYALRLDQPIVAITGQGASPLHDIADAAIVYPDMPEGCPIGCAPMASAVMMLAIGDALTAELMVRRGFGKADFLALHHGGYLGAVLSAGQEQEAG